MGFILSLVISLAMFGTLLTYLECSWFYINFNIAINCMGAIGTWKTIVQRSSAAHAIVILTHYMTILRTGLDRSKTGPRPVLVQTGLVVLSGPVPVFLISGTPWDRSGLGLS
ncbi:hypothetical protein F5887DRAFT_915415 [Amanita rubescens]|nr:hypothetical protein F5887DRAFT_915415 [Amanita rubescens]